MKIYKQYNSYEYAEFDENQKWSCHSWLFYCIDNIAESFTIIEKNQTYLNEKDLVGKYNALNYLLDIFSFHQTSGLRKYPKDRNVELDFCIILHALLKNGGDISSLDYERNTFLDNFDKLLDSQQELSWKQKYKVLSEQSQQLIYNPENRDNILKSMLENEQRPIYTGLCLEFSLAINQKVEKKIKL